MSLVKPVRVVDKKLLAAVRAQPCTVWQFCIGVKHAHHVTTKGAGGGDTEDNLMPLCAYHHDWLHRIGYGKAFKMWPTLLRWIVEHKRVDIIERATRKQIQTPHSAE